LRRSGRHTPTNRNAVAAFRDQLGRRRGRHGSPGRITVARRAISTPPNPSPVGSCIDLQHFRILRVRHQHGRLSTWCADPGFPRQRDELFLDGQMGIVAPAVPYMARRRASLLLRDNRNFFGIDQIIGTVATRGLLRLAAEKLVLERAVLSSGLGKFLFQLLNPSYGIRMSALPIAHIATRNGLRPLQLPL